jgi:glycosyltransferase involved in cell wall biosynthesis
VKICFAIPNAHIGGFRTFTINLGKQFRKDGHQVSALIATRGHDSKDFGDIDLIRHELELHLCFQKRVFFRSRFLKKVILTIESVAPDILILNHTLWPLAALPYLDPRIKRVLVIHNITDEELREPRANSAWWDTAVAVGPGVYQFLLADWPKERVRFIPVGVEEPNFPCRQDFRNSPLKICYIGRLSQYQKNIFLMPDIARGLINRGVSFHFSVVGDGEDGPVLIELINKFGLTDYFTFFGTCNQHKVEHILSEQNILILPSNFESIGHVLQEAQMMGVVPVASRLETSTSYVIEDKKNGRLCTPGKADDFIEAISELDRDRTEMQRLSENGKESVRRRFEISIIAKKYYELFNEIQNTPERQIVRKKSVMGFYSIPALLLPPRNKTVYRVLAKNFSRSNEDK